MASLLSREQLRSLRGVFDKADTTGAGSLSASQVSALLRVCVASSSGSNASSSALSTLAMQDLLSEVDVNEESSDGRADFDQFVHIMAKAFGDSSTEANDSGGGGVGGSGFLEASELAELKGAFAKLDIDGDEFLSASDLQTAFASIGDEYSLDEVQQMLREVDNTGTGRISLNDFLAAVSPA